MERLQAETLSLLQVLFVFCCPSIRKTEPYLSLDRIMFQDPKKSVCITSSQAEREILLQGSEGWGVGILLDQTPLFILPLGCVHVACEIVIPLKSIGVLCADRIQGQSVCSSREQFRNLTTNIC